MSCILHEEARNTHQSAQFRHSLSCCSPTTKSFSSSSTECLTGLWLSSCWLQGHKTATVTCKERFAEAQDAEENVLKRSSFTEHYVFCPHTVGTIPCWGNTTDPLKTVSSQTSSRFFGHFTSIKGFIECIRLSTWPVRAQPIKNKEGHVSFPLLSPRSTGLLYQSLSINVNKY